MAEVKRWLKREPPPLKRLYHSELSSFVLKLHCIFCGVTHSLKFDPRNPSRWQAAYLCKTTSRGTGLSFKDSILEVCGRRKDAWANQVEVRLQGAISDLHTAEARYHDSCRKNSMLFKIKEANTYASTSDTDLAFDKLVEDIISSKSNIGTSSEVHENYLLHGGKGCLKAVFAKLQKHFDDKLVIFSAPGLSSLLVFRYTVPSVFKLVDDNDDDGMIQNISKAESLKILCMIKKKYIIRVDKQTGVSATLICVKLTPLMNLCRNYKLEHQRVEQQNTGWKTLSCQYYRCYRAEREGEWALHLRAVNEMIPYFFPAGHIQYARYGLIYLKSMLKLHGETLGSFLKGEHVQRHRKGMWNRIQTDIFIETMFMRYGHGPGGLIGITLNEKAVHRWAMSLHISSRLMKDMADLKDS